MNPFKQRPINDTDEKDASGPSNPPSTTSSDPPAPTYSFVTHIDLKTSILQLPSYDASTSTSLRGGFGSGSDISHTVRPPSTYAAILISSWDRIRSIGFPEDITTAIDGVIRRSWELGIQEMKLCERASCEWKLKGKPWYGHLALAVPARRLVAHILAYLLENGWHLSLSADLSRVDRVKDTLMFKLGEPVKRDVFSISFMERDKIRLVDPPSKGIKQAFELAVRASWPLGLQEITEDEQGVTRLKLKGSPWRSTSGEEVFHARFLAMAILSAMESQGCDLLGSVAMMMSVGEDLDEMDTWYFILR